MKKITLGVLAHVDSGKTTLSEALLYSAGKIRTIGRVDHKNTFLDTHSLEKNRGITIFSKQATFSIDDTEINLLDTPGHIDFSTEAERVLQVLDNAILVISGTDGVQSHTETLWTLLTRYKIPCFIFVNKMDIEIADKEKILSELKEKISTNCVDFTISNKDENIAVCSENLMNKYLENGFLETCDINKEIEKRNIFPCFFGSALKLEGIENLVKSLSENTLQKNYDKKFSAKVFKISWDKQGKRLTHLKITGGCLNLKQVVFGVDKHQREWQEKINQIRVYSGEKFDVIDKAEAGTVCAVCGLNNTFIGEGLGADFGTNMSVLQPVLSYSLVLPMEIDPHIALRDLRVLEQEDPELHVTWNEQNKEIHLQLMGEIQLEILKDIIEQRFSYKVDFDSGAIVYRETIAEKVSGAGHFEPLKHYAEVHLSLEPLPVGSGIIIDNICKHDEIAENWQRLILSHLNEKIHTGVLTNSPITDMKITLTHAIAHIKHTEGGDFREATYRAIRQALLKAKSVLLEPYYKFKIEIPNENLGRVLTDMEIMGGKYENPESNTETSTIKGVVPVSACRDYAQTLLGFTKGKGKITLNFYNFDVCKEQEKIVKEINYQAENDTENTGNSVFCSHGSGFTVKWQEADGYMHYKEPKERKTEENSEFRRKTKIEDVSEKELLEIFERTYGAIKPQRREEYKKKIKPVENKVNFKARPIKTGPEYILVDGYNIIFDWESLKKLADEDINFAKNKLMDMLCNYTAYQNCKTILVFDAYKVKGNTGTVESYHNISVVYTKEAETADMYIEKVTHKIAKNHNVKVATSDALSQMIILGHGALRLSARAFEQEVLSAEKSMRDILENLNY